MLAKVNGLYIHFSTHFQKILHVVQKCMDRPKKVEVWYSLAFLVFNIVITLGTLRAISIYVDFG